MPQTLRFDQHAPWKQRFRAPAILSTQVAAANKTRAIVASTRSGTAQIYAWDVPTGSLRQLTQHEGGLIFAYLDASGRYIYYHDDTQGNEMGHVVRVPFEGGAPEDITPHLRAALRRVAPFEHSARRLRRAQRPPRRPPRRDAEGDRFDHD